MVKAEDLFNQQNEREKNKLKIYKKIYKNVEKKIIQSSNINLYQCWYKIPEFMFNLPLYNTENCKNFIIKKLKKNGFKINELNNVIFIFWDKPN